MPVEKGMTSKAKKVSTKHGRRRVRQDEAPTGPLSWWRTIRAEHFTAVTAAALRRAVENVAILDEPTWRDAADGDVDAAIAVALRLDPERTSPILYDLVMTALAACAAEESAAACLMMSHILRQVPGAGRMEARIATSWLLRNFTKTMSPSTGRRTA